MGKNDKQYQPIINNAADLWRALTASAELKKIFYDKELLHGNESVDGIYGHLGINPNPEDFTVALEKENISVEKLLVAFFKTLQPYARMMSDLCVFFERHGVHETNKHIRVQFDFDSDDLENIDFDITHFREQWEQFNVAKQLVSYLFLNGNSIYNLNNVFSDGYPDLDSVDYIPRQSDAEWIKSWAQKYENGIWDLIPIPETNFPKLDKQLGRVFNIWGSFRNSTFDLGLNRKNVNSGMFDEIKHEEEEELGWHKNTLIGGTRDRWPIYFLTFLYYRIDYIHSLPLDQQQEQADAFALSIEIFLSKNRKTPQKEHNIIEELQDLLKLPIWDKRYELYSVWILALMDKVLEKYPDYTIYHNNGLLQLSFKATKIASFDTAEGIIELWSEMKLPLENPEGKSRKANVQPDYAFFKNGTTTADNGIAVVEVKQYQTPSKSNFTAALNDYSTALENAHVFLVNYGNVKEHPLKNKNRSTALGRIIPDATEAKDFQKLLEKKLPQFKYPNLNSNNIEGWTTSDWKQLRTVYEYAYIDISGSLNLHTYKEFVSSILKWLANDGLIQNLVAVDLEERQSWKIPSDADIDELLQLRFNQGTSFAGLITGSPILIITDEDGLNEINNTDKESICHVICFSEKNPMRFIS